MNQLPPLPLVDGCLFVDNSGWLESLQTCSRYLQYKQLNKRISAEESAALNFGSAIHLALEFRYRNYGSQPVDIFYYEHVGQILTKFFDQHPPPLDDHRNLNWAMELTKRYNEKYNIENFSLLKYDEPRKCPQCEGLGKGCAWCDTTGLQPLMVEMPFALPLFEYEWPKYSYAATADPNIFDEYKTIKIFYTGKIDLPIIREGETFCMDHKTSGMLGPNFFIGKKLSSQLRGYCWSFQELTKRKVNGFCVNAIRSGSPPQWVVNGEPASKRGEKKTLESWWNDCFQREFYRVGQEELVEWKENIVATIKRFFWEYANGFLPMNTESCVRYGKCQYFDVCSLQPKEERAAFLYTGLYKDNLWSPLKQPTQSKQ